MRPELMAKRSGFFALFGFLVLLAGISLHANAKEKRSLARWEKDVAAFERHDKKHAPPKHPIVFVGSSSIHLWDLPKSFPRLPAINRGISGMQLSEVAHFAPRTVLKYEPRLVVLYAGDNDLGAKKKPQQVLKSFQDFCKVVHKRLPKERIVFISIKLSLARWALAGTIRQTNALIARECMKDERLAYLDIVTPMLDANGRPRRELFRADGLHMNAMGYVIWAERLKPYLR